MPRVPDHQGRCRELPRGPRMLGPHLLARPGRLLILGVGAGASLHATHPEGTRAQAERAGAAPTASTRAREGSPRWLAQWRSYCPSAPFESWPRRIPARLSRSRTKRNVLLEIRRLDFTACIHQPGSEVRASSPVDRRRDAPRSSPSSNTPPAWLLLRRFDRKAVRRELQDLLTDWQGPLEGEPRQARQILPAPGSNSFTAARGSLKRPPEVGKRPE